MTGDVEDAFAFTLRVDALLNEVAAAQKELFDLAAGPGSLPETLARLFSAPRHPLRQTKPETEIAPRIRIGFEDTAEVHLACEAKPRQTAEPILYPHTITLAFRGVSQWLSLEAEMDWSDLGTGTRYRLSITGQSSREAECSAAIRLQTRRGDYVDRSFASLMLSPSGGIVSGDGDLDLSVLQDIDMSMPPKLVLFFDPASELQLRLDQLVAYFS